MRLLLIFLATVATVVAVASGKRNMFEPLYAFDEIDAHTVSASHGQSSEDRLSAQVQRQRQRQVRGGDATASGKPQTFTGSNSQLLTMQTAASAAPTALQQTSTTTTSAKQQQLETAASERQAHTRKVEEKPHHWSALENYYQRLRQAAPLSTQANLYQMPIYQVLQQQQEDDESLANYRQQQQQIHQAPGYSVPGLQLIQVTSQAANNQRNGNQAPTSTGQAFMLPIVSNRGLSASPNADPEFGFSSIHHDSAPGVSRTGGIGSGSILFASGQQLPEQRQKQQQYQPLQWQEQIQQSQLQQVQQQQQHQSPLLSDDSGRPLHLLQQQLQLSNDHWSKLPELLLIQQQQQRAKHQQATFGSWYDHKRINELLQEEAFCGPRNYVGYYQARVGQLEATKGARMQQDSAGGSLVLSPITQLQMVQLSSRQVAPLTVSSLSAGEYPSHMGVYNGTPGDSNYLCAATWLHERYALTLASCVASLEARKLNVRAGEWNFNRNSSSELGAGFDRPTLVRQVESVSVFPKYRNNSGEHDLALLRLLEPIDYLEVPYICPACQAQSRSSLRASACWAPVRKINLKEYFDAEGEGETKERREISMAEMPVRLLANDDECYRHTGVEFFNFQHPNYICSPDFKNSEWRLLLNQTEYLGSGIYCNEGGTLSLVSVLHHQFRPPTMTTPASNSSANPILGFTDLTYYRPWMRNVISGRAY